MHKEIDSDPRCLLSGANNDYCLMHSSQHSLNANSRKFFLAVLIMAGICACAAGAYGQSSGSSSAPGEAGEPYPNMPSIAPIGVRIAKYMDVPASAEGPALDPAKGYRLQDLGKGLYMITDNAYQSMFLVYDRGVVVIDAPPGYASHIPQAIGEVSDKPITHIIYTHSHIDHIGGAKTLGGRPVIIAQEETLRLLKRAADPNRPLPTVTFSDKYTLRVGNQVLELSYHGNAHEPGNIFIYAPLQRVTHGRRCRVSRAGCPGAASHLRRTYRDISRRSRRSERWIGIRSLAATLRAPAPMRTWTFRPSSIGR
jgi:hypothetical protein